MNKLLLSTAVLTFGALATSPYASAAETITQSDFSNLYEKVTTSSTSTGFHAGDFQFAARGIKRDALYDGAGSSLMSTVRLLRY